MPRSANRQIQTIAGYKRILQAGGFGDIEIIQESVDFISPDEDTWWTQMRRIGWERYLNKIGDQKPKILSDFKDAVFKELQEMKDIEGIHFKKHVLFVFGKKL